MEKRNSGSYLTNRLAFCFIILTFLFLIALPIINAQTNSPTSTGEEETSGTLFGKPAPTKENTETNQVVKEESWWTKLFGSNKEKSTEAMEEETSGTLFGKEEKTWWTKTKEFFGFKEKTWYEKIGDGLTSGARTVPEMASILIITGVLYGLGFFWKRAERYNKNPIGWMIFLILLIIFAPRLDWASWFGIGGVLKFLSVIITPLFKLLYKAFVIREIAQILWMLFIVDIIIKIFKYLKGVPDRIKEAKGDDNLRDGVRTLFVVGKSDREAMNAS